MRRLVTVCVALLVTLTHAHAACRDDLQQLKPRVERIKFSDKERYALASKWLGAAEKAEPHDEAGCQNYYIRALRALKQPVDAATNNTAMPGGGGAGSSAAPVGPATKPPAGPAPPRFTPPPPTAAPPKK